MSEYNLGIRDLIEGEKYKADQSGVAGGKPYHIEDNKLCFTDCNGESIESVININHKFKLIKPEPELVELFMYDVRNGESIVLSTADFVYTMNGYKKIPYQIKDGKIFIEVEK